MAKYRLNLHPATDKLAQWIHIDLKREDEQASYACDVKFAHFCYARTVAAIAPDTKPETMAKLIEAAATVRDQKLEKLAKDHKACLKSLNDETAALRKLVPADMFAARGAFRETGNINQCGAATTINGEAYWVNKGMVDCWREFLINLGCTNANDKGVDKILRKIMLADTGSRVVGRGGDYSFKLEKQDACANTCYKILIAYMQQGVETAVLTPDGKGGFVQPIDATTKKPLTQKSGGQWMTKVSMDETAECGYRVELVRKAQA